MSKRLVLFASFFRDVEKRCENEPSGQQLLEVIRASGCPSVAMVSEGANIVLGGYFHKLAMKSVLDLEDVVAVGCIIDGVKLRHEVDDLISRLDRLEGKPANEPSKSFRELRHPDQAPAPVVTGRGDDCGQGGLEGQSVLG